MSIAKTFKMTPQGAQKMDGWHSWRHQTRDAQDAARVAYLDRRGPAARRERAATRGPMPHGAERAACGCTCQFCREAVPAEVSA